MSFDRSFAVMVIVGGLFGCVDQRGTLRVPHEALGDGSACERGYLLGPDENCWPISEGGESIPAASVWAWNLSPETGGTCQYGDDYEPDARQVHLVIGVTQEGFSLFDVEGEEYPCDVDGARFRCEGVVTGAWAHGGVNVNQEHAADQTSLTFEGIFNSSTDDGFFVRAAGTYSQTHTCHGYQCADLEEELGPDFSFPCRGLGGFASQLAN